jgi:lysophospholipase L1-like esterase
VKKINFALKILIAQILTLIIILILVEVFGKTYAYFNPGHETLYVIPDKYIGWRMTPDLQYVSTGANWYASEFAVKIKHNSLGFRDNNRSIIKPNGTKRIVLLGDSSVSARQVEFKNTPGQVLERLLNQNLRSIENNAYEVLNFGIDGIGVGQSFLTYRKYANAYNPDYVFLFIFEGDIWRTVAPLSAITDSVDSGKTLSIRPIFNFTRNKNIRNPLEILNFVPLYEYLIDLKTKRLKPGNILAATEEEYSVLINSLKTSITEKKITQISKIISQLDLKLYPTNQIDYDEFIRLQANRIKTDLGEDRTKVRKHKYFLVDLFREFEFRLLKFKEKFYPELKIKRELDVLVERFKPRKSEDVFSGSSNFPNFESVIFVNLKVLEILNKEIISSGKNFTVVDASSHIIKTGRLPGELLSEILYKYCKVNNIGYIPLSEPLNKSANKGLKTLWPKDGHMNENGYKIFGEAMFQWMENN